MKPTAHTPSCTACDHVAESLFCELTLEQLETLDSAKVVRRYRRGQPIFAEGDPPDNLYCICFGIAELYKIGSRDEEVVIRLLRAGDVVGYRPMLANEPMAASARAIEDATICLVSRTVVFDMVRDSPKTALTMLRRLARELRVSEDEMVARVSRSAPERVARFLICLMEGLGGERNLEVDVPLRRVEMAHVIGIAPETLSRILRDFEQHGIVHPNRRLIRVHDVERLRSLATGESVLPNQTPSRSPNHRAGRAS